MSDEQGHYGMEPGPLWPDLIICGTHFEKSAIMRVFPDKEKVRVLAIGEGVVAARFKNALVMPLWQYYRERKEFNASIASIEAIDQWLDHIRTRVAGTWVTL